MGMALARADDVVKAVDQPTDHYWTDIERDTYDLRAHFAGGVAKMSARLDDQIRVLRAKRAAMTTDTKDWDLDMKGVDAARSLLTSRMDELSKTNTPEDWASAKDNIRDAWERSQQAVDKMNTTVTT